MRASILDSEASRTIAHHKARAKAGLNNGHSRRLQILELACVQKSVLNSMIVSGHCTRLWQSTRATRSTYTV
jgi:hypothetical protein